MHPIAFQLGQFSIYWFGVMIAVGCLVGLWTAGRRAQREALPPEKVHDLGLWLIVGALVGARLLYVLSYWREQFADQPLSEIFAIRRGGLVFYGGLMGASLACILYVRWKRLALWRMADILAPSIALGYVFGRIGCLLNGCCYGRECALPWAIHFPYGHNTHPAGLHPTQVYDSILSLALYGALAWLYRRKRFDGQVFAAYLVGYAVLRSLVEMFRGDYPPDQRYLGGWVTPAQIVSILTLLTGLALFWLLSRRPRQTQ